MYIHSLLWIDFGDIYIYIYIYCGRKKTNKLPVHPYRPVSRLPTHQGIWVGNHETGLLGWTGSLFVFFLPQYIHRSTTMYWALSYVSQNYSLYIYLYIQSQFTKAKMRIHLIGTFYMTTFANYSIHFSCDETFLRKKKCYVIFNMQPGNALFLVKLTSYKLLRL